MGSAPETLSDALQRSAEIAADGRKATMWVLTWRWKEDRLTFSIQSGAVRIIVPLQLDLSR